jgi:hypothetical protein
MVMQHVAPRTVVAVLLMLGGCGSPADAFAPLQSFDSEAALGGGRPCGPHQFSETGAVLGKNGWLGTSICTGTLLAADVVLTAAHCVDPRAPQRFVFDPRALTVGAHASSVVVRSVIHPNYKMPLISRRVPQGAEETAAWAELEAACGTRPGRLPQVEWRQCVVALPTAVMRTLGVLPELAERHDLALMFLAEPVQGATLAMLPHDELAADVALHVVGYGSHGSGTMLDPSTGERYWGQTFVRRLGTYELATTGEPAHLCAGDSGAPAFAVGSPVGQPRPLVGIGSQAGYNDQGQCVGESIFQRVDVHAAWIKHVIQQH